MTSERIRNEQSLVMLLNRVTRSYRRFVNRGLAAKGLSDAQALPVVFIERLGGGIRQGVLADEMGLEAPSLARQIDQLCTAGLVDRRGDPKDGRAKVLFLTPAGHELAAAIETILAESRSRLLQTVADTDLTIALQSLQRFENALDAALDGIVRGDD